MVTGIKPHLHIVRSSVPVYQLRIALTDSEPLIWRQLLVPGSITLATLHVIFQHAMGWHGSHQHEFVIGDTCYGQPDPDYPETVSRTGEASSSTGDACSTAGAKVCLISGLFLAKRKAAIFLRFSAESTGSCI